MRAHVMTMLTMVTMVTTMTIAGGGCLQPRSLEGQWVGEVSYAAESSALRPENIADALNMGIDVIDSAFTCELGRCTGTSNVLIRITGVLDEVELIAAAEGGPDIVSFSADLPDTSIEGVDRLSVGLTRLNDTESDGTLNLFIGGGVAIFNGRFNIVEGASPF
jgi:hypothetical protein